MVYLYGKFTTSNAAPPPVPYMKTCFFYNKAQAGETKSQEVSRQETPCKTKQNEVENCNKNCAIANDETLFFLPLPPEMQRELSGKFLKVEVEGTPQQESGGLILRDQRPKNTRSIEKDGNCLFRSLSFSISGSEDYHSEMRKKICEFETKNFKDLLLPQGENYVLKEKMMGDTVWGTNYEIAAAAKILQTTIHVFTQLDRWKWVDYPPSSSPIIAGAPAIYLYHQEGTHFVPVLSIEENESAEAKNPDEHPVVDKMAERKEAARSAGSAKTLDGLGRL